MRTAKIAIKIHLFIITSLLLLCLPPLVFAEDDWDEEFYVEEEYGPQDPKKEAVIELSGASASGNSKTSSLYFGTELDYRGKENWAGFSGSSYYSEAIGGITARILEGRARGGHSFNADNYIFLLGTLKHDNFQQLDLRSSMGIGYGYKFINVSFEELSIEGGVAYQNENFRGNIDEDYAQGRAGLRYLLRLSTTARFSNESEYLQSFKDPGDYRIRSEFKLGDRIYKGLGIVIRAILDYDSTPITKSVEKFDARYFGGITYNFF